MGVIHNDFEVGDYAMEQIYNNAIVGGCSYLKANPAVKTLIMGFSGGIDSLVTGVLARAVVDKMNDRSKDRPYRLVGYSLPIISNKEDEIFRAKTAGDAISTNFTEVNLSPRFPALVEAIDNSLLLYEIEGRVSKDVPLDTKIRVGNLKARLRMMFLYDKANKYDGMVLSTDNYTELLLGFWTLHGDVGDFGFLQELWKTEVYGLADWFVQKGIYADLAEDAISATPTDGLGVSNSDLDQLLPGWTGSSREGYEKVDQTLLTWEKGEGDENFNFEFDEDLIPTDPVIRRHLRTEYKRHNPINLDRWQLIGLTG